MKTKLNSDDYLPLKKSLETQKTLETRQQMLEFFLMKTTNSTQKIFR